MLILNIKALPVTIENQIWDWWSKSVDQFPVRETWPVVVLRTYKHSSNQHLIHPPPPLCFLCKCGFRIIPLNPFLSNQLSVPFCIDILASKLSLPFLGKWCSLIKLKWKRDGFLLLLYWSGSWQETGGILNLVIWGKFNTGNAYKGVGRLWGNCKK